MILALSRPMIPTLNSLLAILLFLTQPSVGQQPAQPAPSFPALERDPAISQIMKEISADRIQQTIEKLVSFETRQTLSVNNPGAVTSEKGIVAARKWIKAEFERYSTDCGGCLEVKTDTFIEQPADRIPVPTEIQNVYAVLRGSDPAQAMRIYLVTGHYDSRNSETLNTTDPAPGANDDASGTAVSLECARVLSKHKFPATLIFLTVAGEEEGLNGSAHFAKMAKAENWRLEGVLNNDIVGGNLTPGDARQQSNWVRVFSEGLPVAATDADRRLIRATGGESDSPSRELARYVREIGHLYDFGSFTPKLIFRRDRYLRGGDHTSFNTQGFAAVRFTEYREDYNHQHQTPRTENGTEYGDLLKFVDFNYVANVTRLNAATLAALALAPAPPTKVKLLAKQLENTSHLTWDAAPGASSYEVLWRDTMDSDFVQQNVVSTAKPQIEFDQSKDNVIFAVRSVDAKGHRSLLVFPTPEGTAAAPVDR